MHKTLISKPSVGEIVRCNRRSACSYHFETMLETFRLLAPPSSFLWRSRSSGSSRSSFSSSVSLQRQLSQLRNLRNPEISKLSDHTQNFQQWEEEFPLCPPPLASSSNSSRQWLLLFNRRWILAWPIAPTKLLTRPCKRSCLASRWLRRTPIVPGPSLRTGWLGRYRVPRSAHQPSGAPDRRPPCEPLSSDPGF